MTILLARCLYGPPASFTATCRAYLQYYEDFFVHQWTHMTPTTYAGLLGTIAFIGWVLMRSRLK